MRESEVIKGRPGIGPNFFERCWFVSKARIKNGKKIKERGDLKLRKKRRGSARSPAPTVPFSVITAIPSIILL